MIDHVNCAVLGAGFMGAAHVAAINHAARDGMPCALAAVCDADPANLAGRRTRTGNIAAAAETRLFDPASVRTCTDPDPLFADPSLHLFHICTPTDTHYPLALRALAAGKHVIIEKPVALQTDEIRRIAAAAGAANRFCMAAMCMRFWPGWDWARDRIRDRSLGALRSASFERLGSRPSWSPFYADPSRSGGALLDLHIHDADFIRWALGPPAAVTTTGVISRLSTTYHYAPPGPSLVVAQAGWLSDPAFPFRLRYILEFERGIAEFDSLKSSPLSVAREDRLETIELDPLTGYDHEIRHAIRVLTQGEQPIAPVQDAVLTAAILDAERDSLSLRTTIQL